MSERMDIFFEYFVVKMNDFVIFSTEVIKPNLSLGFILFRRGYFYSWS